MIKVFKWIKGINKGNIDQVLEISSQDRIRGNGYKLEKQIQDRRRQILVH